jgi:hypothetical protein
MCESEELRVLFMFLSFFEFPIKPVKLFLHSDYDEQVLMGHAALEALVKLIKTQVKGVGSTAFGSLFKRFYLCSPCKLNA